MLDSVGCGGADDAGAYGDEGADTLGHIAARLRRRARATAPACGPDRCACPRSTRSASASPCGPRAASSRAGLRRRRRRAANGATASRPRTARTRRPAIGRSPARRSTSPGAISRTRSRPSRQSLTAALIARSAPAGHPRRSPRLRHRRSSPNSARSTCGRGKPICYTSADSVFQIAAHEEAFGLERLYEVCRIARRLCDPLRIGRVIARPFVGRTPADFVRTAHRKDFSIPPPPGNLARARGGRPAARSSRSARSATSSPIASPGAKSRAATTAQTST